MENSCLYLVISYLRCALGIILLDGFEAYFFLLKRTVYIAEHFCSLKFGNFGNYFEVLVQNGLFFF